jgi:putative Ca2+/H+ antiporter (TMEM165/GDT1 family)
METFFVTTGLVALAEMGDKTQLLSLALAARYQKPLPIILGILLATLANHSAAVALGGWIQGIAGGEVLRYAVGAGFVALGAWMLIPDRPTARTFGAGLGPFVATLISFFIAEMGDKTQLATVAFAGRFQPLYLVVIGTTLGLMIANVPVVFVGNLAGKHLPLGLIRGAAAAVFLLVGGLILAGVEFGLGEPQPQPPAAPAADAPQPAEQPAPPAAPAPAGS